MADSNKKFQKLFFLRTGFIQMPIFILAVVIYALGLSILVDSRTSASIASKQFVGNGATLYGIFCDFIILGAFNLFFHLCFFIFAILVENWSMYMFTLGILNLIFSLISEALFFKFASCFNFPSNTIFVARSSLVIILMMFLIGLSLFVISYLICNLINFDWTSNWTNYWDSYIKLLVTLLLILPPIIMLVLNSILIARLRPQ